MEFEYDPNKSASNKVKHGIDFEEAKHLWDEPVVVAATDAGSDDSRTLVFGTIKGKHWTVVVTEREGRIRLISARRSRKSEEAIYDCKKDD